MSHTHSHWDDLPEDDNPTAKKFSRSVLASPMLAGVPTQFNRGTHEDASREGLDNWEDPAGIKDAAGDLNLRKRGKR